MLRRKKYIISLITVPLIVLALLFLCSCSKSEEEVIKQEADTLKLPLESDARINENPLMYDFLTGHNGWHTNELNMKSIFFVVCENRYNDNAIFVAYHPEVNGDKAEAKLPGLSYNPMKYVFNNSSAKSTFLNQLHSLTAHQEGDYNFYFVKASSNGKDKDGFDYNMNYGGIDLAQFTNAEKSPAQEALERGRGYNTEFLRAKAADIILTYHHFDINDSRWDRLNYKARYKCFKTNNSQSYVVLSPEYSKYTYDADDYMFTYSLNDEQMNTDADELNNYLVRRGYESIDTAISSRNYANESEKNGYEADNK